MIARLIYLNAEIVRLKTLIAIEKDPDVLEQLKVELEWIKKRIKEIGEIK